MEFHYYSLILIASLTGLPAQLTRATWVSRVCQVFPSGKPLDRFAAWLCQPALAHPPRTVAWLCGSPTHTLIFASRAVLYASQACMASPAPREPLALAESVRAILAGLDADPKLGGKGLSEAFARSFPELLAEAKALAVLALSHLE